MLQGLLYIIYQAPPKARTGLDRLEEGPNPRYRVPRLGKALLLLDSSPPKNSRAIVKGYIVI